MSRQSKNARNLARAKQITGMHKNGEKGPAKTSPKHGKTKAWWQIGSGDYANFVKGKGRKQRTETEADDALA